MPAKILGVLLFAGGLLLLRDGRKARERGYLGPRHRRVHRAERKWKFRFGLFSRTAGGVICLISAFLCLTAGLHH